MEVKGNEGLLPSCYKHKSAVKKIDWQAIKKNMILSIEPKADLYVRGSERFKLKFTLRRKLKLRHIKLTRKVESYTGGLGLGNFWHIENFSWGLLATSIIRQSPPRTSYTAL